MNKQQPLGWQQWLLIAGLVLSLVVAAVFAIHGLQRFPRRQADEQIRGWMSVPYIARSHRVPAALCYAALGLPAQPPDRRPLMFIARAQHRPVETLIVELQNAIAHYRLPSVLTPTAPARSTP